jgi:pimeloyl-ACP methyl ester carboxylesterase
MAAGWYDVTGILDVKRLLACVVTVSILLSSVVSSIPVVGQPNRSVDLRACKFSVGLADAKHEVDAQCGILHVPEDPAKPSGRKIDLHFVVLAATKSDARGVPIFHFEGGPGGAAISSFGESWYSSYRLLREMHDVVLIDQRGTGQSASLQCTEISDSALDDLAQPLSDDEAENLFLDRLGTCLDRLAATNDPAFYTSTILADDTDAVRAALGYDQIDVFGNSYGTWLAQIYLRRHGDHVHAMVLDSTVGPWNNYLLTAARSSDASLDKIFDLCKADAVCNKTYPDLPGQLQTALDKLEEKPVTLTAPSGITGNLHTVAMTRSRLLSALQSMLYLAANVSVIPQTISQAAQGNNTLAASTLISYEEQTSDLSLGLYYSVHCSETAPFLDVAAKRQPGRFFGRDYDEVKHLGAVCKVWRSAELAQADVAPVKSERPVLILSGALDPVTPVAFAEETHARLKNSTLAVFPFQAHGPMVGSKCAQTMVADFFQSPTQTVDTSCTARDVKPVFMGAYKVDLVPFNDPNGSFAASIPKGWTRQDDTSKGSMTFFASPDDVQLLGIGIFKGKKLADGQKAALDSIAKAYGPVEVQQQMSQSAIVFTITIVVHSLDRPDQAYLGMIIARQLGRDTQIVWQAAPSNIFQAVLLPVAPLVFASVVAR